MWHATSLPMKIKHPTPKCIFISIISINGNYLVQLPIKMQSQLYNFKKISTFSRIFVLKNTLLTTEKYQFEVPEIDNLKILRPPSYCIIML